MCQKIVILSIYKCQKQLKMFVIWQFKMTEKLTQIRLN